MSTHALDHLWGPGYRLPNWLQEGGAEYFAYAARRSDHLVVPGRNDLAADEILKRDLLAMADRSLSDLVDTRGKLPDKITYVHACAFVHFLHHGESGRWDAGFRRYLAAVTKDASRAALEAALGTSLASLQAAFKDHVESCLALGDHDP